MPDPEPSERFGPLLAIETATGRGSVALLAGDALHERTLPEDLATAESLLPTIDALLAEAGCGLADVRRFAVSIGPGSFTGLRIGVATLKGLLFGRDAPVAPVPTLAALALRAEPGPGPVVALLDARRDELYAAGHARPGTLDADALPEGLYAAGELAALLPEPCRLVGDPAGLRCGPLRAALAEGVRVQEPGESVRAADVARLGAAWLAERPALSAAELVPRYVRRAQAEAIRTGSAAEPAGGAL